MPTSPWVLDLTSNPPNIFNEDGTENLHNALESPYPVCFWYVSTNPNDVTHMGALNYHSPCFESPYPSVFWSVSDNGIDIIHAGETIPEEMGAFKGCTNLTIVSIPSSVANIGSFAFWDTGLSSVSFNADCIYDPNTSFPEDCNISLRSE